MIPRLHLVTDDAVLQHPAFISTATEILAALHARVALHVRARELSAATIFRIVDALQPAAAAAGAALLVNDRVDVALTAHAHGVHLGVRSLPVATARTLLGSRLIGYSAHSAEETAAAERAGADFVFAGSIYQTASHPGTPAAGLPLLKSCVAAGRLPVLAIGGVDAGRIAELRAAGAHGVAVIRAVWSARAPVHAAQILAKLLEA